MSDSEIEQAGESWQKKSDINLHNAWITFGHEWHIKHPHLKLYAENWNW